MQLTFIIDLIRRIGSKSPKLFKAIQYLSFGTAIVAAIMLYLSEKKMITLPNQDTWNEMFKGLMYSGFGSGGTASATTTNPDLISHEVKTNIINTIEP